MRVMIRQGVSRDMAALLVEDIKRAIDHFEKHPITGPDGQKGSSGAHPHLMRVRSCRERPRWRAILGGCDLASNASW